MDVDVSVVTNFPEYNGGLSKSVDLSENDGYLIHSHEDYFLTEDVDFAIIINNLN